MNNRSQSLLVAIGLFSAATLASLAVGQNSSLQQEIQKTGGDEIPKAALQTEKGRELVDQLRQLRRNEASMGSKHPLLPNVRAEIAEVKAKLAAWSREGTMAADGDGRTTPINPVTLQQLVLNMSARIQQLERRVDVLETKLEIF